MEKNQAWVLVIGILMITMFLVIGVFFILQSTIERTFDPVESMTGNLSTRVSQIFNPTPTILPSSISILREIRNLSRLETIQFTVDKVITAETGQGIFEPLLGDRLLFVGHGNVIAGIDMAKLTPEDIQIKDGVLTVQLPAAEIFTASLDNEKSYVYDRDTGLFTKGDVNLETLARRAAETEIKKTAQDDGILELARQNAESYLYRLFRDLGFQEVIFIPPEP